MLAQRAHLFFIIYEIQVISPIHFIVKLNISHFRF